YLQAEELSKKDFEELLKRGSKILTDYLNEYFAELKGEIICEYAINGVQISDKVKIGGRIDRIEKLKNGKDVIITDLKTGKPKSRNVIEGKTKSSTGDYKRQVLFYKLLVDGYHGKQWNVKKGVIEFVEPDEKGSFHREEFTFELDELEDL